MNQYIALARKWRPNTFSEFVGQLHVVKTLINSLDNSRIHHAYIFSGTRGVGKTTLARLLAKCLNCEKGISSTPCNKCHSCRQITDGTSIDLIEVDAASRTKVEDTRELLDNIQLSPSSSKYRIYLIDEVHMLSKHSFNALLKTLEEPPAHVKFLFATTEVEKLPITILSRCIHFKLKSIDTSLITDYLKTLMAKENITFDPLAIDEISKAAKGSMRDALTLVEQFISFGNGAITNDDVIHLLGIFDKAHVFSLLEAIIQKDTNAALKVIHELAILNIDFDKILDELLYLLHQITLVQATKDIKEHISNFEKINHLAKQISPEDLQLLYQIGVMGRKDLPLAPSYQIGLEMTIIRMICFIPEFAELPEIIEHEITEEIKPKTVTIPKKSPPETLVQKPLATSPKISSPTKTSSPSENSFPPSLVWEDVVDVLGLNSAAYIIASNCIIHKENAKNIELILHPTKANILTIKIKERINDALNTYLKKPINLSISVGSSHDLETPISIKEQKDKQQTENAKNNLLQDPNVQDIMQTFNAKIIEAEETTVN